MIFSGDRSELPPSLERRVGLGLAFYIERHGSADEFLQSSFIDHVAFVDVDGAADISLEAGVEQAGRVLQRSSFGKCHLHVVLVRLSRANEAAVRPGGNA